MSNEKPDEIEEGELIECALCFAVLNGRSLWVTNEGEPKTLCEECHARTRGGDDE